MKKLKIMIISSKHKIMIFTDHEVNSEIAHQTKLALTDIMKQNLKLVRVLMFMSEFNIQMIHRPDKSHTVSDTLSCLSSDNHMNSTYDELDIEIFHTYSESVIILSTNFERQLKTVYKENAI